MNKIIGWISGFHMYDTLTVNELFWGITRILLFWFIFYEIVSKLL